VEAFDMADLSLKRARQRLKIKPDPYTMRLNEGCYLTFRRGPDTWGVRYRDRNGKQQHEALKDFASGDYDGAVKAAAAWIEQMSASAVRSPKRGSTVADALQTYLADLERHGRIDAARAARTLFKTVFAKGTDPLSAVLLEKVSRDDFQEWRDRLRPGREARSVNRYVNQVVAAMNVSHEQLGVGNPLAWSLKSLADDVEEEGTAVFLDPSQRAALIAAAEPHAALFLRGLELTGARPSELAATVAGDFDGKTLRLSHRKGRPAKLRQRFTVLDQDGVVFFARCAADKLPAAPLFTIDGSRVWRRNEWAERMREAIKKVNAKTRGAARIPPDTGAYAFRHARISELLQVYKVDPLTVGHQTGTSLAMVEKAYLKFIPQALQDKLAAIKAQA
jgi:integrase